MLERSSSLQFDLNSFVFCCGIAIILFSGFSLMFMLFLIFPVIRFEVF